jgi:hypothetical protein
LAFRSSADQSSRRSSIATPHIATLPKILINREAAPMLQL